MKVYPPFFIYLWGMCHYPHQSLCQVTIRGLRTMIGIYHTTFSKWSWTIGVKSSVSIHNKVQTMCLFCGSVLHCCIRQRPIIQRPVTGIAEWKSEIDFDWMVSGPFISISGQPIIAVIWLDQGYIIGNDTKNGNNFVISSSMGPLGVKHTKNACFDICSLFLIKGLLGRCWSYLEWARPQFHVQCGTVITQPIFSEFLTKDTPYLAR